MNAKPADDTAPAVTPADDVPPWLYRSEGFAEDLDESPSDAEPAPHNVAPRRG